MSHAYTDRHGAAEQESTSVLAEACVAAGLTGVALLNKKAGLRQDAVDALTKAETLTSQVAASSACSCMLGHCPCNWE